MNLANKLDLKRTGIDQFLSSRLKNVAKLIGNTPLFKLNNIIDKPGVEIYAKLEWLQLAGSIKSRPAFKIIKKALENGEINQNRMLLDASSGNTAISYATIAAALGLQVTICLPENAGEERKNILKSLRTKIVYTSKFESTDGAQRKARELFDEYPDQYYYADQYSNENNWKSHLTSTGPEILNQTKNRVTHFVAGLGTTGSFVGVGRALRAFNPDIQLIALQPDHPLHGLEGWKHMETAKVPKIYDNTLEDASFEIDTNESYDMIKFVARKEGLLLSPSAAANLLGAVKVAMKIKKGVIVTTFADNADRYSELYKTIF